MMALTFYIDAATPHARCDPGKSEVISYAELVEAIKPWGEVQAILRWTKVKADAYIVSFRKPVRMICHTGTLMHTPFTLRQLYDEEGGHYGQTQSSHQIFFRLNYPRTCYNDWYTKSSYCVIDYDAMMCFMPGYGLDVSIEYEAFGNLHRLLHYLQHTSTEREQHSPEVKKWLFLQWITLSGLSLLKYGIGGKLLPNPPSPHEIISNYQSIKSSDDEAVWELVAQKK